MSKRTVKPEAIKTLKDWAARWPAAGNLGFDPETREPAIFSVADRKQVSKIPWVREGDTMTILTQPDRFSEQAVTAARARFSKIREQRAAYVTAAADQLRSAETALLDAWRAYRAAAPSARGALRRDIMTAEKAIVDIEAITATQIYKGRELDPHGGVYVPPMERARRGIPLTAVAGAGAGAGAE